LGKHDERAEESFDHHGESSETEEADDVYLRLEEVEEQLIVIDDFPDSQQ